MKKKNKFILLYEEFTKKQLEELTRLDKTYVKKLEKNVKDVNIYGNITNDIRNYDVSNFKYILNYGIYTIYPDNNFIEIIKKYNELVNTEDKVDLNFVVQITVTKQLLNQIDITDGIPVSLRRLGLAYRLYKEIIIREKFITSNKHSSLTAYNLWYHLLTDNDLMCFTSNFLSGVMLKNISNEEIKLILDKLPKVYHTKQEKNIQVNYEFDDYLKQKHNDIYGDLHV